VHLENFSSSAVADIGVWTLDAVSETAFHRSDVRPCSCGGRRFVLVMRGDGASCHAYCSACYGRPGSTLARKDDVLYGELTAGGGIGYVGDPVSLRAHRERLKAEAAAKAMEGIEPVLPMLAVGMRVRYARPDHEPPPPRKSRKGQVAVVVSVDVDLTHRKAGDKLAERETAWIEFSDRARIFAFADQLDRVPDTGARR
jgi:hypothetical protein